MVKDCLPRRSSAFSWSIILYLCSMFRLMTRNSWQLCCAIVLLRITTLAIISKGSKMLRAAQDSDQSGIRSVELYSFSGASMTLFKLKIFRINTVTQIQCKRRLDQVIRRFFRELIFHCILISFCCYLDGT